MILDSTFSNVGTAVLIGPLNSAPGSGSTGLVLENIAMSSVQKAVADSSGKTILASTAKIDQWVAGPTYSPKREFSMGKLTTYKKPAGLLDSKGAYFERAKPQYEDKSASDFVHLKNFGAKGRYSLRPFSQHYIYIREADLVRGRCHGRYECSSERVVGCQRKDSSCRRRHLHTQAHRHNSQWKQARRRNVVTIRRIWHLLRGC